MKKFKLQVPEKVNAITFFFSLLAYYKTDYKDKPFHINASDYEKAIKSNDFLPEDIELVRYNDGIAYATSKDCNYTFVWVPTISKFKGAIGFCIEGLINEFPDIMDEDPLLGYAFNIDVSHTWELNLFFDL